MIERDVPQIWVVAREFDIATAQRKKILSRFTVLGQGGEFVVEQIQRPAAHLQN